MQDAAGVGFGINIVLGTTASTLFATKAAYGGSGFGKSQLKLTYDKTTKTWASPAGLIYGYDKKYGNRIRHVLSYTGLDLTGKKAPHSVFSIPKGEVLGLLDEAWRKEVIPFKGGGLDVRVVHIGRVIRTQ